MKVKEARGVGQEWEEFGEAKLECVREACCMQRVGCGHVRKGREWCDDGVKLLVKKKGEVYWQSYGEEVQGDWEMYMRKWQEIKRLIQELKKIANESWG